LLSIQAATTPAIYQALQVFQAFGNKSFKLSRLDSIYQADHPTQAEYSSIFDDEDQADFSRCMVNMETVVVDFAVAAAVEAVAMAMEEDVVDETLSPLVMTLTASCPSSLP